MFDIQAQFLIFAKSKVCQSIVFSLPVGQHFDVGLDFAYWTCLFLYDLKLICLCDDFDCVGNGWCVKGGNMVT